MWIDDYVKLVFGEDQNQETIAKGADLKYQYMPNLLYKYRSFDKQNLDALQNDYIYSSQPEQLNDPFEGAIGLLLSDIRRDMHERSYANLRKEHPFLPDRRVSCHRDLIENIAIGLGGSYDDFASNCSKFEEIQLLGDISENNLQETVNEQQQIARNMYNVYCLSANYDNLLMWALYADSHKGFCIGYDIKGPNNDATHLTFPILYKQDFCNIDDLDCLDGNICMYALTVKSPEWSYESEWRTFFQCNPPGNKEAMPPPKVIYLGAKITETNKNKLKVICKQKGIVMYQMNLVPEKQILTASNILD